MCRASFCSAVLMLMVLMNAAWARAESVKLGKYSGQPGYFVRVGKGDQDVLNAIAMTPEAAAQLQKLNLKADMNQTRTCDVEGLAQSVGYTIFVVRSCR